MQPNATPERSRPADQDARLAYQAYRDALHLAFPMDWEKVPAATQQAWRAVVLAMRERGNSLAEPDVFISTFLEGETMMLRLIWHGEVLQCALSLTDITAITGTIAEWQRVTLRREEETDAP